MSSPHWQAVHAKFEMHPLGMVLENNVLIYLK
jgi:hypothetical protein